MYANSIKSPTEGIIGAKYLALGPFFPDVQIMNIKIYQHFLPNLGKQIYNVTIPLIARNFKGKGK